MKAFGTRNEAFMITLLSLFHFKLRLLCCLQKSSVCVSNRLPRPSTPFISSTRQKELQYDVTCFINRQGTRPSVRLGENRCCIHHSKGQSSST